jgi:hypothetical protein
MVSARAACLSPQSSPTSLSGGSGPAYIHPGSLYISLFCFVMTSSGFGCYVFLGVMLLSSYPKLCYACVMSEMGYEFRQ